MRCGAEIFNEFTYDELLPMLRDAGFDGYFAGFAISDDPREMERVVRLGERLGLRCENAHAPIPGAETLWTSATDCDYLATLFRAADNCGRLGIPALVVHVEATGAPDRERGMTRLMTLAEYAKKQNVEIAFENIHDDALLRDVLAAIPKDHAGFCYDVGHAYCYTEGRDFLTPLAERLTQLHVADNDAAHDLHLLPFDGVIPFAPMMQTLCRIGFNGSLMLELSYTPYREQMGKRAFVEQAYTSVQRLKALCGAEQ